MCAVLRSEEGEIEKVAVSVKECIRLGIKILPPNVNYSQEHFSIIKKNEKYSQDAIVFGLSTIKNLGSNAVEEIIKQRKIGGKFKNLSDFIRRIEMKTTNKKSLEALINSGAFDDFQTPDINRSTMFLNIEDILSFQRQIHDTHAGEMSLFGELEGVSDLQLKKVDSLPRTETLKLERELLGLYLSGHPLDPWKDILAQRQYTIRKILDEAKPDTSVDFAGIITDVRVMLTKKKDKMAFIQVADLDGEMEVVVFPKSFELFKNLIIKDTPLLFRGKVSLKNRDEGGAQNNSQGKTSSQTQEPKIRDDGKEAKVYANKAIILDEIRKI
jgi:DNA polymerase-3 subunit alpha